MGWGEGGSEGCNGEGIEEGSEGVHGCPCSIRRAVGCWGLPGNCHKAHQRVVLTPETG